MPSWSERLKGALDKGKTVLDEGLAKGKVLADQGLAAGEKLAGEALEAGKDALGSGQALAKKGYLRASYTIAIENIAAGYNDIVEPKYLELHTDSLRNPDYAALYQTFEASVKAAIADKPETSQDALTAKETVIKVVDAGITEVSDLAENLGRQAKLANLAVDNAPKPVAYYLG